MTNPTIDYCPRPRPTAPRKWPFRLFMGSVVVVVGLMFLEAIDVRQVEGRVDSVTGTICRSTTWFNYFKSPATYNVSPLETKLKASGIPWKPSWQLLHNTHKKLFGRPLIFDCGSTLPIYELRPWMDEFVAISSDEQLRAFVHTMESGSDIEQTLAIYAAINRIDPPATQPTR